METAADSYPTPRVVASAIRCCPECQGKNYKSVTENTGAGFKLRALQCEGCGADILGNYLRMSPASRTIETPGSQIFSMSLTGLVMLLVTFIILHWD